MPNISMKELQKFMKNNPNADVTQVIKEQLDGTTPVTPDVKNMQNLTLNTAQKRSSASNLVADKVNKLHKQVLNGFLDICQKAIMIGQILSEQKEALEHGQWLDWVENELTIGPKQVQTYAKIYCERESVLDSIQKLAENGIKPSIRKMLAAATKKDNQSIAEYSKKFKQHSAPLTPREKQKRRRNEKRRNEISSIAQMYIAKEVDDNSLRALVLKWNNDNTDNYQLFVEDVLEQVNQINESNPETRNHQPSCKINVMLSIDADLWESFVSFGGREVFLNDYIHNFITEYVIEQKSYRIAN